MNSNPLHVETFIPCEKWGDIFTLYEPDSDSKFYDIAAASRVCERIHLDDKKYDMNSALAISRTRIEFNHEHWRYADSSYMKSLGSESDIWSKFAKENNY